ncbi:MAG: hypothetical protein Fur005_02400 [Roseiflexaceae bacterium]
MNAVDVPIALPEATIDRYRVIAQQLFLATAPLHRLPERTRLLLDHATRAYAQALLAGSDAPDRAARDALLAADLDDDDDRAVAACIATFQRSKLRTHRETAFLRLRDRERVQALRLAAILQCTNTIAQSSASQLAIRHELGEAAVQVAGPQSPNIADSLSEQAWLWRDQIGAISILVGEAEAAQPFAPLPDLPPLALVPDQLAGDEPAGEGTRRMLRRFFERMLAREEDVRRAEDPEDVHQMRVATRRLRATLQVLEPIFDPEQIRRFRRGLRRAAAALGTVRDYDVFLSALRSFQAEQSAAQAAPLDRVIATVERERAKARITMLEDLQGGRYARFKHAFAIFLTTPGADLAPLPETGIPPRVRDIAGSIIWRRYEAWRAFEVLVPQASSEQLHMARIAGKRLRYVLEAFADPLGPKSATALQQLADLQEHMGLLQDGATAHMHLANLGLLDDPGAQIYLAHLTSHHEQLLSQLPALWQKVASATYRRNLFEMIIRI